MGWIVYSKDGQTVRCVLHKLEYSGTFMGDRAVIATFSSEKKIDFNVFDYITYRGEHFELELLPTVKKVSTREYKYELRFVSLKYELERCMMRNIVPGDNGIVYPTPLTVEFTGDVKYLAERIQACLDAMYGKGTWSITIAEGTESEEKNISLSNQNCWDALSIVNTEYKLNYFVKGRNVTIGGEEPVVDNVFEYGKGKGLYEIERSSDTDTGVVTKLRAYGGTRNLDYSYPKLPEWTDSVLPANYALSPLRLMLPSFKTDGKTDYILAPEEAVAKYGIREGVITYDDIYPSITGMKNSAGQDVDEIKSVSAITSDTQPTFTVGLYDLGFDLSESLTTDEAQLSMKSGALQGYTFNITKIDRDSDGSYTLTLGRNTLEEGDTGNFTVPNKDWSMKAGDKFVLLNILMPQEYIRDAENRLLTRAKEYLAKYSSTNYSYNVGVDEIFMARNVNFYNDIMEGKRLTVNDQEIGINNENIIIQSLTIKEGEGIIPTFEVTLNNEATASTLDRIQGQISEVETSVSNNFSSQSELLRQYRKKLDKSVWDSIFVIHKDDPENPEKITSLESLVGLWTNSFLSAKGLNPGSGGGSGEGGATALYQLNDVAKNDSETNVLGAAPGKVLTYGTDGKWYAADAVGLDETALSKYLTDNEYTTRTWVSEQLGNYTTTTDLATLLGNKVDKVDGKGLSTNDFTDTLLDKLNSIEENANKYILPIAKAAILGGVMIGSTLTASATGVLNLPEVTTAGTYAKVTTDIYGRVTSGSSLSASDIPALSISKITGLQDALNEKVNKSDFNTEFDKAMQRWFVRDTANKGLHPADYNSEAVGIYSDSYISAKGANPGSGGGSGGDFDRLDSWSDYDASKSEYVLSAGLGWDLNTRLSTLESQPSGLILTTSGTGNGLAGFTQSGNTVTFAKTTFLTSHQSIYGLTIQRNFATLGTYTPNSSSTSINIAVPENISELNNDVGFALKSYVDGNFPKLSGGLIPSSYLPSYVDDVIEAANVASFPTTGESGKIYVALNTNLTYRWSGTTYVEISPSLALGETSTTAYAGDKGKANATAIAALKAITISAGTGLTGGGNLTSDRTISLKVATTTTLGGIKVGTTLDISSDVLNLKSVITSGTYTKVTVDTYGRVTSGASLAASDIPSLSISKITGLQDALDSKLTKTDFASYFATEMAKWFVRDVSGKAIYPAAYSGNEIGFYSKSFISAMGLNPNAGGGGGGGLIESVYGYADLGKTFSDSNLNDTFNAYTVNRLASRITSLENSSITEVPWGIITNKPSTLGGYGITDALSKTGTAADSSKLGGFTPASYDYVSAYNFTTGCLVKTNISASTPAMCFVHIIGNGYASLREIDTTLQFYNYPDGNSIINSSATNYGLDFGDISVFNYNGVVYLWFKQTGTFQTFFVYVHYNYGICNRVTSITNASKPTSGITRQVTVTPKDIALTTSNVASATKLATSRTIWGQPFNGTADVSGALSGVTDITASGVYSTTALNPGFKVVSGSTDKACMGWTDEAGAYIFNYTSLESIGAHDNGYPVYGKAGNRYMMPYTRKLFYKSDYERWVVLLWEETTGTHRLTGELFTSESGSARYGAADVRLWYSRWSTATSNYDSNFIFNTYGVASPWDLVTCKYGGKTYFALQYTNTTATSAYFTGTYSGISFTAIKYYTTAHDNVAAVVNNSEIYNSIADVTTSVISANGTNYALTSSNVASATKLQTSRTLWGQSFDGTASINGTLTSVGHIQFLANATYSIGTDTNNILTVHAGTIKSRSTLYVESGTSASIIFKVNAGTEAGRFLQPNGYLGLGTTSPTERLHVAGNITANILKSTIATGTAPLTVASTTVVTNLNADLLDGKHLAHVTERQYAGSSASGTKTGWFRIGETSTTDAGGCSFILFISRNYSYLDNESYTISVNITYGGYAAINQISGYSNAEGGGSSILLDKIRITGNSLGTYYVDIHIAFSTTTNQYYWSAVGSLKTYDTWKTEADDNITTLNNTFEARLTTGICNNIKAWANKSIFIRNYVPNLSVGYHSGISFGRESSNYNNAYVGFRYAGSGSTSNGLNFGMYGADNLMFLNGLGNLGIGTITPSYKLHVVGNGYFSERITLPKGIVLTNSASTAYDSVNIRFGNNHEARIGIDTAAGLALYAKGSIYLRPGSISASSGLGLVVNTSGDVSISGNITNATYTLNNSSTNPYLKLVHGGINWYLQAYSNIYVYLGAGTTNSLRIDNQGNTYTPGTFNAKVGIWSDGYVSAKGQNTTSDMRLKNKGRDVFLTIKDIANAPAFEYTWKDGTPGVMVGSSAQYWRGINENLAPLGPDGKYLAMQYGNVALLGVISLARHFETLEERVKRLEKENLELREFKRKVEQRLSA